MNALSPESSVRELAGIGPAAQATLAAAGVNTVGDLLNLFPKSYLDYSCPRSLRDAEPGETGFFVAHIHGSPEVYRGRTGTQVLSFHVTDEEHRSAARVSLFGQPYLQSRLRSGGRVYLYGKPTHSETGLHFSAPKLLLSLPETSLQPVYPQLGGLSQGTVRKAISDALKRVEMRDPHSKAFLEKHALPRLHQAYRQIHAPASEKEAQQARSRFVLDETFVLGRMLDCIQVKTRDANEFVIDAAPHVAPFMELLPFGMTPGQEKAIRDVCADLSGSECMNRLVQGDVGCGKTTVAMFTAYAVLCAGWDAYLLAPTEVLARQHARTAETLFPGRVVCITGHMRAAGRREAQNKVRQGRGSLIIGTHALLYGSPCTHRAALLMTDEQHRFGVQQRRALLGEHSPLHSLTMTATPIPRSLALALYGQTNISVIRDLPPGRQPIQTSYVPPRRVSDMYDFIARRAREGKQAYIVCAAIEESDAFPVQSAVRLHAALSVRFPDVSFGLVHGQCSAEEKAEVMDRFREGACQILITTSVIEVGVDVPQASVIAVLDADRFGLAQLHQLRGRVGRGSEPSYCFLTTQAKSAAARLNLLCHTSDGFEVAEEDLKERGAGDFLGERQHGIESALTAFAARGPDYAEQIRKELADMSVDPACAADFRYFTMRANQELDAKLQHIALN